MQVKLNMAAIQTLQQTHTLPPLRTLLPHVMHTYIQHTISYRLLTNITLMCIRKSRYVS